MEKMKGEGRVGGSEDEDKQPLFAGGASSRFTYFSKEAYLDVGFLFLSMLFLERRLCSLIPSTFIGLRYENPDDAAAAINGFISELISSPNFVSFFGVRIHVLFCQTTAPFFSLYAE
ncbi:hypothetical protein Dimus_035404 [Dionaea muscipula]